MMRVDGTPSEDGKDQQWRHEQKDTRTGQSRRGRREVIKVTGRQLR